MDKTTTAITTGSIEKKHKISSVIPALIRVGKILTAAMRIFFFLLLDYIPLGIGEKVRQCLYIEYSCLF